MLIKKDKTSAFRGLCYPANKISSFNLVQDNLPIDCMKVQAI